MLQININELLITAIAFIIAGLTAFFSLKLVLKVDSVRHLTDDPGPRKVHNRAIPTLGGVGIFVGFAMGFLLTINGHLKGSGFIFAAIVMLFFIGLCDVLIHIKPNQQLAVEILGAIITASLSNIHVTTFHGFLGITEIPGWLSLLTTVFIFVVIINSLNLIDGIDGLAASTGIIATSALGLWFWFASDFSFVYVAASLVGALLVFLTFNISNGKKKIFMGDTGSLVIGFIIAVLIIRFNELNAVPETANKLHSAPAISIAILIVPLFDTLRVFFVRILHHQSPFKADKRHIHHLMLQAGFSHRSATLTIASAHLVIIAVAFSLDQIGILWLSLILMSICLSLTGIIIIKVKHKIELEKLFNKNKLVVRSTNDFTKVIEQKYKSMDAV